MMLFKKISILFLIFFIACGAGEGDVEVTENISSNSDEPTTTTEPVSYTHLTLPTSNGV